MTKVKAMHNLCISLEIKSKEPITQEWLNELRNEIDLQNDYTRLAQKDVTCIDWKEGPCRALR